MEQTHTERGPALDREHGYYAAISVTNDLKEVLTFCQDISHVEKVLMDLPQGIANFLDLKLTSVGTDRVEFQNQHKSAPGSLTFLISEDEFHGGTIITAEAKLGKIHFKEDGPSTLMNVFLKRMKNLLETGEIPTTKGQPSGREEIKH